MAAKTIRGVGSVEKVSAGKITAVAGAGSVEQVQPVNGTGELKRTCGSGGVNDES
jgi:hypothetical protein